MAAPATQHALSVPELLDAIFLELKHYSDVSEWQDPQHEVDFAEPDLFHLIQVNRLWRDRALRIMWREIPPQAVIYLSCMPAARQQHYATMIRNITVDSTPGDTLFDGLELSEQLRFPLAHDLTICFTGEPDWDNLNRPDSGRSAIDERAKHLDDPSLSPASEQALEEVAAPRVSLGTGMTERPQRLPLSERFPLLTGLTLTADDAHIMDDFEDVEAAMENSFNELASAVRKWPGLRGLTLQGIAMNHDRAFPFFGEIARSHSLRSIKMKRVEKGPILDNEVLLATLETSKSPFTGLSQAELACARSDATHLVRTLSSDRMETLKLYLCDLEGFGPEFEPTLFPSIRWSASFATLTDLCIRLGDDNEIQGTEILALGAFHNLRALSIVVAGSGISGKDRHYPILMSDLDNQMFATLCRSLPLLQSLALHVDSGLTATALLYCGRSCRKLQRITLSGTFDLTTVTCASDNSDLFPELIRLEIGDIRELAPYAELIEGGNLFQEYVECVEGHIENLLEVAPKMQRFSLFGENTFALVGPNEFDFAYRVCPSRIRPSCYRDLFKGVEYGIYQ